MLFNFLQKIKEKFSMSINYKILKISFGPIVTQNPQYSIF